MVRLLYRLYLTTWLLFGLTVHAYVLSENKEAIGKVSAAKTFPLCDLDGGYDSFEFHVDLNLDQFCGFSNIDIFYERVSALSRDFSELSGGKLAFKVDIDFLFHERTSYLTKPDGTPFPEDKIKNPVYTSSCGTRSRSMQKLRDTGIQLELDNTTSFKMNGIDASTFLEPKGYDGLIDCNVYSSDINVAYTAEKEISKEPTYSVFEDVLDVFDFADQFFKLPLDFRLPPRSNIYATRFVASENTFDDIPVVCLIDLEFKDYNSAYNGTNPNGGELSCEIYLSDIKKAGADIEETIEALRALFVKFYTNSIWAA